MREIWKYILDRTDRAPVSMPKGAQVLSAGVQGDCDLVCIWALVDPEAERVGRRISVYGTGWPIADDPGVFVGTVSTADGALVWHVFDGGEVTPNSPPTRALLALGLALMAYGGIQRR